MYMPHLAVSNIVGGWYSWEARQQDQKNERLIHASYHHWDIVGDSVRYHILVSSPFCWSICPSILCVSTSPYYLIHSCIFILLSCSAIEKKIKQLLIMFIVQSSWDSSIGDSFDHQAKFVVPLALLNYLLTRAFHSISDALWSQTVWTPIRNAALAGEQG